MNAFTEYGRIVEALTKTPKKVTRESLKEQLELPIGAFSPPSGQSYPSFGDLYTRAEAIISMVTVSLRSEDDSRTPMWNGDPQDEPEPEAYFDFYEIDVELFDGSQFKGYRPQTSDDIDWTDRRMSALGDERYWVINDFINSLIDENPYEDFTWDSEYDG